MTSTCTDPDTSTPLPTDPIAQPPAEVARLRQQLATACQQLAEFRDQARAQILHQHEFGGWCFSGTNNVLDDLDLPPILRQYTATITITASVRVDNADSEDQARSWILNALDVSSTDSDVEIDDSHVDDSFVLD